MLTGFYHRSVLRCGCLAERDPGVEGILTGAGVNRERNREKKLPIVTNRAPPGQRAFHNSNLWKARDSTGSLRRKRHCKVLSGMLG